MANIEMNYFNGNTYDILYPKGSFNNMSGNLTASQIPNLDASKINSGTLGTSRIPNLSASKITSGVFGGNKGEEYVFPGNLRVGGTGSNSDAYIRIGDGDYVHFHEDSDDNLTIKAKRINFLTTSTPGLTNNGNAIGGGNSAQTGSYNGTGVAGSSNYNSITTSFLANIVIIVCESNNHFGIFTPNKGCVSCLWDGGYTNWTQQIQSATASRFRWYVKGGNIPVTQMNEAGFTYYFSYI